MSDANETSANLDQPANPTQGEAKAFAYFSRSDEKGKISERLILSPTLDSLKARILDQNEEEDEDAHETEILSDVTLSPLAQRVQGVLSHLTHYYELVDIFDRVLSRIPRMLFEGQIIKWAEENCEKLESDDSSAIFKLSGSDLINIERKRVRGLTLMMV